MFQRGRARVIEEACWQSCTPGLDPEPVGRPTV